MYNDFFIRNRLYSELFEDLPDRHEYPEYYSVIKNPRSLSEVAEKMQTRSYPNLYAWMSDMKLVFENALKFNEPGSRIFRDAKLLLVCGIYPLFFFIYLSFIASITST